MYKLYIIFDLDGTLSNHNGRLHLVTGERKLYDEYYDRCNEDPCNDEVLAIMSSLIITGHRVEIWTGRPKRIHTKTVQWLNDHGLHKFFLRHMRDDGDFRPDYILKNEWLEAELVKPDMVFEDRPRMVEFWRSKGIFCFDVGGQE